MENAKNCIITIKADRTAIQTSYLSYLCLPYMEDKRAVSLGEKLLTLCDMRNILLIPQ